jgi:hypothetical protein
MQGIDQVLGIKTTVHVALEWLMPQEAFHVGSNDDAARNVVAEAIAATLHAKQLMGIVTEEDMGMPCLTIACRWGA